MNNKNMRFVWLAIVAILGLFIGGKWNIPLAAWLSPIFAIRFFRDSDKAGRNFLLLWLISAIPTMISWRGATAMSLTGPIAEPIFFLLTTPLGLLPYVVDRMYYRRFGSSAWLTLVYPIASTALDYFSASGSPFGSFGAGAYSQRDALTVMQLAAFTGLWGITFVAGWVASLVNHLWENGFKFTRLTLAFSGILLLIFALGLGRTLFPAPARTSTQVAGFSLPVGKLSELMQLKGKDETAFRQAVEELHTQHLAQIRAFAQQGANIVVLQEGAGLGDSDQVAALLTNAAALARETGIYIVLPTFDLGVSPAENKVHIIDPSGAIVLTHTKYGGNQFEGTLKGDGILQSVETPYGKLSAIICWDADFPLVVKQAGEQDVELLFVPSNDWLEVKDIHAGMARFRAVENGMTIFRQTGLGIASVIDSYGRELNRIDTFASNTTGFTNLQMVATPIRSVETLYPLVGDALGNITLLGLVGLLIGLWVKRPRKTSPQA